jgi:HD-like signal output (HDOD) protein
LDHALSIIKVDPFFAARVIVLVQRECKSALTETLALDLAIRALGRQGLVAPLFEHSQAFAFAPTQDAQKHLWLHATQVTTLSEQLSYWVSWTLDGEWAYFAGLLHDLER